MPRTNYQDRLEAERAARSAFKERVYGRMKAKNATVGDVCDAAGFKNSTWDNRMREPKRFTLEELSRISARLDIPLQEIVELIVV
ncbi:MAG: helix-turn-helix transcriptional regulator [Oscillospiraceae bacterium]|nr:helix-turn-helix transcriptional regulator [Oscillospiraceae bacterium]